MARATRFISELQYMIGKDRTGLELLASLTSLTEACDPSNIPSVMRGATFEDYEGQLGVSMPPMFVYMANAVPSINIPFVSEKLETIKVNKVPLGFSFTPLVASSGGGFGSGNGFGSGDGAGGSGSSGGHGCGSESKGGFCRGPTSGGGSGSGSGGGHIDGGFRGGFGGGSRGGSSFPLSSNDPILNTLL